MEYFFSHIVVLIIAAVLIALVAFSIVLFAEKNEAGRDINEEKCNGRCTSCANSIICNKPEKNIDK